MTVTNTGTVTLDNAMANGLPALDLVGNGETVTYTGSGSITNTASTPLSSGLRVTNASSGDIVINASGPITGFRGIDARVVGSGEFHITNSSTITGTQSDGVFARGAQGTSNTIDNSGTIISLGNSFGIFVGHDNSPTAGSLTITNSGNIQAGFRGIGVDWVPLGILAPDGGVTVNSTGNITAGDIGIHVLNNTGAISVAANNVTSGFHGINVSSLTGNVSVQTTGAINAGGYGVFIDTGGEFLIVNAQSGSIAAAGGDGIFVLATVGPHPEFQDRGDHSQFGCACVAAHTPGLESAICWEWTRRCASRHGAGAGTVHLWYTRR